MAQGRKYAHLLDIDDAPDVYESAEAQDATQAESFSTHSESDFEDQRDIRGISRGRLQPDQARDKFDTAKVDARQADFSDKLSTKKQSYIVSSRRQKSDARADKENSASEEEDDDEGLARRIARLTREVEEVRSALRLKDEKQPQERTKGGDGGKTSLGDIEALSRALDTIQDSQRQAISAHARLAKQLADPPATRSTPVTFAEDSPSIASEPIDAGTLAQIAAFDTRLASLESALGLNALDTSSPRSASVVPVLPTLSLLDQQISLLSSTNIPSLEAKLAAYQTLQPGTQAHTNGDKALDEDEDSTELTADDIAQLRSLYSLIPTLTSLGPTVPAVISRLRSLRHLHTEAGVAGQTLDEIERRQTETEKEIKAWREGLDKVEGAIKAAETGLKGNVDDVEKWVRELEGKIKDVQS